MDEIQVNKEIDDVLKEFEKKNQASIITQTKEQNVAGVISEGSTFAKFIVKHSGGLIKEEKYAEYVLLVFVIIIFGISFYIFWGGKSATTLLP